MSLFSIFFANRWLIPTSIYFQNLASIQPRTSPLKFAGDPGGHELGPHYSFAWYRAAARAGGKDDRAAQAATTHAVGSGKLEGSFSSVWTPNFASKYALESSRRDLHDALLCTVL